ncbi:MAG TPA: hypothetical protein VI670_07025 [Thermoanaerobaculia bacterium]|jgi:uncharacterized repeat protein (TIGR02543 family)
MKRTLIAFFMALVTSNAVAQLGTLDGYATISLSADESTVTSAADVTYIVSSAFNCTDYAQATTCTFTLSGAHAIQPGFQSPFLDVDYYRGTIQGPTSSQTCYSGSIDAAVYLKTDAFSPISVNSGAWTSDREVCTLAPPAMTFRLRMYVSMDGAISLVEVQNDLRSGTALQYTAVPPTPDWVFIGWSGDLTSSDNPVSFNIYGNMDVTANFTYIPPPRYGEPPPCDNCGPGNPNPPNSPIVLNLGRGAYQLAGAESPVEFDIAASGTPIRIGWTEAGADEAFLCLDRNHNGEIDDGSELFGTATRLNGGARAPNGFEALAEYDDNHDGVIDAQDQVWSQLLLWRDLNHDGISQLSELSSITLSEVKAIGLDYHWTGRRDSSWNTFRYEALAWFGKGNDSKATPRPIYDIFFVSVP